MDEEKYQELREAAEDIWEMLEAGDLVRSTKGDFESGWALRQLPMVRKLARFGAALGKSLPKRNNESRAGGRMSDKVAPAAQPETQCPHGYVFGDCLKCLPGSDILQLIEEAGVALANAELQCGQKHAARCSLPPAGWWCSRDKGHDGPCAARRVGESLTGD